MIVTVDVGLAMSRPPQVDRIVRVVVVADTLAQAVDTAAVMACITRHPDGRSPVMPVSADVIPNATAPPY